MIKNPARRTFLKNSFSLLSTLAFYGCGGSGGGSAGTTSLPDENPIGTVAPTIVSQPQDAIVAEGDSIDFSVITDSDTPVAYQWRKNGVDISSAVNSMYTAIQVSLAENGDLYSVLITNSAGSITSNEAELTVLSRGITVDSLSVTVDSIVVNVASI